MSESARDLTRRQFGRTIGLYTPLYISNYCENHCVYCGFHSKMKIGRKTLSLKEIENECWTIKETGIQNILILTGESRLHSPVSYIKATLAVAKKYSPNIALEIYPLETEEYRELFLAGADGVALYQETYDEDIYRTLHLSGKKRDYQYRYHAPERMAEAGIRHIAMGVLLGLANWEKDVAALFNHLDWMWKKYPGVEYSLSFPRLQAMPDRKFNYTEVTDDDMLEIVSSARLRFPRAGINLSTREKPAFRDKIVEYGITKMSAGSLTTVGGYAGEDGGDGQFEVNDHRSLAEIKAMLAAKGYDPVMTDWRNI